MTYLDMILKLQAERDGYKAEVAAYKRAAQCDAISIEAWKEDALRYKADAERLAKAIIGIDHVYGGDAPHDSRTWAKARAALKAHKMQESCAISDENMRSIADWDYPDKMANHA